MRQYGQRALCFGRDWGGAGRAFKRKGRTGFKPSGLRDELPDGSGSVHQLPNYEVPFFVPRRSRLRSINELVVRPSGPITFCVFSGIPYSAAAISNYIRSRAIAPNAE
jgi:hypothetical protein